MRPRSRSEGDGESGRERPLPIALQIPPSPLHEVSSSSPNPPADPFHRFPQPFNTEHPFLHLRSHENISTDPLDDVFRAMAATYTTPSEQQRSDNQASTLVTITPHILTNLHAHTPQQFDTNTLALLQLLQVQAHHQAVGPFSPSIKGNQEEGSSSSASTTENARRGEADDEDQMSETDRVSLADDKRARNTAASARFRNKKKQWMLNLERTVTRLTRRVDELEKEASDLRRENGWLKEIVMLRTTQVSGFPSSKPETNHAEPSQADGNSCGGKQKRQQ